MSLFKRHDVFGGFAGPTTSVPPATGTAPPVSSPARFVSSPVRSRTWSGRSRRCLLVVLLAGLVAVPSLAVAQEPGDSANGNADSVAEDEGGGQSERVTCEEAGAQFFLLCKAYDLIKEYYFEVLADEDLATAAAEGIKEAELTARTDGTMPACALPAPEFEQVCVGIDATSDTAGAIWAAAMGMVASLDDEFAFLLSPEQYSAFLARNEARSQYEGIGVRLGLLDGVSPCLRLSTTCRLTVADVMPDSPAEQAGLLVGDIILELDGLVPTGEGCGLADLRSLSVGTQVSVTLERNGEVQRSVIEADLIEVPAVISRIIDGTIGYLSLASFGMSDDVAFAEHLQRLIDGGVESLVIDLQNNPGGFLAPLINIAGYFVDDDDVVFQEHRRGQVTQQRADKKRENPDASGLPVVVLVDDNTASASEVLLLALREHRQAEIVGVRTYGKVTEQVTIVLSSDDDKVHGVMRLPIATWSGPTGTTAVRGVRPDVAVEFWECSHPLGMARQAAAATGLKGGAIFADVGLGPSPERSEAIWALADGGVLQDTECEPGLFCPGMAVPRWVVAVWLARAIDGADPARVPTSRFEDVNASLWWAAHVERLAALGVTVECGQRPTRFCPDQTLTRGEAAMLIQQAFKVPAALPAGFEDVTDRSVAAAASALLKAGITRGCSSDPLRFCPDEVINHAQMAVLLHRANAYKAAASS